MIQDMLHEQKGINWNYYPTDCKRGNCCIKTYYTDPETSTERSKWIIDKDIPIFKGDDRAYIDKLIYIGE